ncbi:LysR family transcriptional regulator [Zavarzinia sp.]|uniref:LysR family transcriptional regulator n=1 Tax=Zavarzinia sp. TaxID=2027920 RepID=UPI003561380D
MNIEPFSLDQLRVFSVVVETGSFSAAAKRLQRAQSAVSYAIAALEGQLGIGLFDRSAKRPQLTRAGQALLADARAVLAKADAFLARAAGFGRGVEAEVSLVVDVLYPGHLLPSVFAELRAAYPTVAIRLEIEALGAVTERVVGGATQIGIFEGTVHDGTGLSATALHAVRLVPVAAPGHALAQVTGTIETDVAAEHVQLVLTDRSRVTEGRDFDVISRQPWRLGDLATKRAMLLAGTGWGTMPMHLVAADLAEGRLVRLRIAGFPPEGTSHPLFLARRTDRALGPAGLWLWQRLLSHDSARI